jgi:hypothetical protein
MRLEERGWIQPLPVEDRRRPYKLMAAGRRVLRVRLDSLENFTRVAQTRLADA